MMKSLLVLLVSLFTPSLPVVAQQFQPPEEQEAAPEGDSRLRLGLFGFGARGGIDVTDRDQVVMSVMIDAGDFYLDRLRIRPSFEMGFANQTDNNYLGSLDLMYRFTADAERAVPYVGFGMGVMGQQRCGDVEDCPEVWPQFTLGFELKYNDSFNWLLEYRGEDALGRHRFLIGLASRRSP